MDHTSVAFKALIEGRVQGVGFRYFVQECAEDLALTGWVRNCERGHVEVFAEGPRGQLELLLKQLERGPRAALVTNVTVEWQSPTGLYKQFSITTSGW